MIPLCSILKAPTYDYLQNRIGVVNYLTGMGGYQNLINVIEDI